MTKADWGKSAWKKVCRCSARPMFLLLVIAADTMVGDLEQDLLAEAKKRGLPYLIVLNKTDLLADPAQIDEKAGEIAQALAVDPAKVCPVSTDPAQGIGELKERLAKLQPKEAERPLIRDLLEEGDLVVLVVPIDSAAPKRALDPAAAAGHPRQSGGRCHSGGGQGYRVVAGAGSPWQKSPALL